MADSSRVEELRKRYHENPRRFFAPLANEYRKTGMLDRALLLCEKHLGEQPGNMNGLIVYGQCLFESGRHADAKAPFTAALEVDPENLIALRHLGDIARLGEDHATARGWYQRVLELDRRNEEVQQLYAQVGGDTKEPPSGGTMRTSSMISVASSVSAIAPDAQESMHGMIDLEPPSAPSAPKPPPPAAAPPRAPAPVPTPTSSAKTVEVTPRPLAQARTLEVPAAERPKTPAPPTPARPVTPVPRPRAATPEAPPAPRASLLDIDFDFIEPDSATPDLPPKRAAAPSAPPRSPTPAAPVRSPTPSPLLDAEVVEYGLSARVPDEPLIEMPPEPVVLGEVARVEGLEAADYSADVEPLANFEPAEFTGTSERVVSVAGFETAEFEVPASLEPLPDLGLTDFSGDALGDLGSLGPPPRELPSAELPLGEMPSLDLPSVDLPSLDLPSVTPRSVDLPFLDTSSTKTPATPVTPAIVTETMAKVYLEQGFRTQAIDVYRKLIAQDPGDASLKAKLAALEAPARTSVEFATPAEAVDHVVERTPANAMLSEISFLDVALTTPVAASSRIPTPAATPRAPAPPVVSGPSAREFFGAFSRRAASPTSPNGVRVVSPTPGTAQPPAPAATTAAAPPAAAPVATPSAPLAMPANESSLDAIFGVGVGADDQRAANLISGIGSISAPSGSSPLDTLFAVDLPPSGPSARQSVPRASEKLRFDQFFSATSTPPAEAPAVPPATPPASPSAAPMAPPSASPNTPPAEGDDLDQFHGWLKGLKP